MRAFHKAKPGAGAAWPAPCRGLRTALVEREDFGSGTSSKSTKLVHGGVRYLVRACMHAGGRCMHAGGCRRRIVAWGCMTCAPRRL